MRKKKKRKPIRKVLARIEKKEDIELKKLGKLEKEVKEIERVVKRKKPLRKIGFIQTGGCMATDFSIVAGQSGFFSAVLTPSNGAQAPGTVPQWSASDPSVVLVPSPDGLNCEAQVPAGFTAASFDLQNSAQSSDSSIGTVTGKHTISVSQPPPPPPPPLTGIDFVQTS